MLADDDVGQASFVVERQKQAAATAPTTTCLDAVRNIHTGVQTINTDCVIQNAESQPSVDPRIYARNLPPFELHPDPLQSASANIGDVWASAEVLRSRENGDGRPSDMVDHHPSSSETCDSTNETTVHLERAYVDSGSDQPEWLTVRRRYLDNQILRRQLRCQRADALVNEQFIVVLGK